MERKEMVDTIGFQVIYTGKMLIKRVNSAFSCFHLGLTFEQMGILYYLFKNDDHKMIQQDIAKLLNKTKSAALRTINVLETKNYLSRVTDKSDRRKNIIQLTPAGRLVISQMHERFLDMDLNLNNSISSEDANTFRKVLLGIQHKCI